MSKKNIFKSKGFWSWLTVGVALVVAAAIALGIMLPSYF